MDSNEIMDFHKLDGIQIMRNFNLEVLKREEEPELEDIIIEQQNFNTMISEMPIETREIIANLLERNFKLEEENEELKTNMDIAFKYFNQYIDNQKLLGVEKN